MIKDEVIRCLEKDDRKISWLADKLGISWTGAKEKIKKDTFTANELLEICILFDDFNINRLIQEKQKDTFEKADMDDEIHLNLKSGKIGTLFKNMGWQSFVSQEAEELFNDAISDVHLDIKKSKLVESNAVEEMNKLGIIYTITKAVGK